MSESMYISKIKIHQEPDRIRRAYIEGFEEPLIFGVHAGIRKVYGIESESALEHEHPATLDHLVAALAG